MNSFVSDLEIKSHPSGFWPWTKFIALSKREFLDSRTSFFLIPVVIIGLTLLSLLLLLIKFETQDNVTINLDLDSGHFMVVEDNGVIKRDLFEDSHLQAQSEFARVFSDIVSGGVTVALWLILPFAVFFGLLGTLYDDRKDRSYLFWKSMPVSDSLEVLTKFSFYAFVGPAIFFMLAMLGGIAAMVLVTPFVWSHEGSALELLWAPAPFISMWVAAAGYYFLYVLWILPVLAWLLLASAYAPKAPMMFAVVPIIAVITMETIFTGGSTWLGEVLLKRIGTDFGEIALKTFEFESDQYFQSNIGFSIFTFKGAGHGLILTLASAKFWIGHLFTAAFLTSTVYLRRYRF